MPSPSAPSRWIHQRGSSRARPVTLVTQSGFRGWNSGQKLTAASTVRVVSASPYLFETCLLNFPARQNFIALFAHSNFTVRSQNTIYLAYNRLSHQ